MVEGGRGLSGVPSKTMEPEPMNLATTAVKRVSM